jgi:hypothetical protein
VIPPFVGRQPIQGVSSVLRTSNGEFWSMSDNGFGAQTNSADYVLRVHRIAPDFKTRNGGTGIVDAEAFITLSDPYRRIDFPIVADGVSYPNGTGTIEVDPEIREKRLLTGADVDIESFRQAHDGTLWFGDEFGPVIERDNLQGAAAAFKKIFVVRLGETDGSGFLVKRQVADLLQIADPYGLAGAPGAVFRFPFQTIESVIPFGNNTLGVLDDNNYPFSNGRTPGQPDPNEFIVIRLERPLVDK